LSAGDDFAEDFELHRPVPDGLEVLREESLPDGSSDRVLFGTPQAWEQSPVPASHDQKMSLEDIFIALTGKRPEL
jgi:hypothetical protein